MSVDLLAVASEFEKEAPLVNESSQEPERKVLDLLEVAEDFERGSTGRKTEEQLRIEREGAGLESKLPAGYAGEFTSGFGRGVDQMQQALYGVGAIGTGLVGMDKARDYFVRGMEQQDKEIAENPTNVPTYEQVENFDTFMRYVAGGTGELAPNILESVATGIAGGLAGSAAAPGAGTAAGVVGGFVERQAVRNLIKTGVKKIVGEAAEATVKKELKDYAQGKIAKEALSEFAGQALNSEVRSIAGKYGATTALGMSSFTQAAGGIYSDLSDDPNVKESDRRAAAIVGGIISAIPETFMEGYIAKKFFPGGEAAHEQLQKAQGFLKRFAKEYGTELVKVAPGESITEGMQTVIEEASKNWARGDDIFSYTREQKVAFIDSMIKGAMGGTVIAGPSAAGNMIAHPNPKVREDEADILTRAGDQAPPPPMDADPTELDNRLSAIGARRAEIEVEMEAADDEAKARLNAEITELDREEDSLVNESEPDPLPEGSLVPGPEVTGAQQSPGSAPSGITPAGRAEERLRAFYGQILPNREVLQQQIPDLGAKISEKRTETDSLVNEIEQQDPEYAASLRASLDDNVIAFMAAEDIKVRMAKPGDIAKGFAVFDEGETIVISVPAPERMAETAISKDMVPTLMGHEIIHAADLVQIRDEWRKGDRKESFSRFEERTMEDRGRNFVAAYRHLPYETRRVYRPLAKGGLEFRQIGQELPRMAVELARTGQLTEVTAALDRASKENTPGAQSITAFLENWIRAIKNIHERIVQMLDPTNGSAELKQLVQQINEVLDKYGVLVNENQKEANKPAPKEEVKPEPEPVVEVKEPETIKQEDLEEPKPKKKKRRPKKVKAEKPVAAEPLTDVEPLPSLVQPEPEPQPDEIQEVQSEEPEAATIESAKERASDDSSEGPRDGRDEGDSGLPDDSEGDAEVPAVNEGAGGDARGPVSELARAVIDVLATPGPTGTGLEHRLSVARQTLAERLPIMLKTLENMAAQARIAISDKDTGPLQAFREKMANIRPLKGQMVADSLVNEKHALYIAQPAEEISPVQRWLAEHSLGMQLEAIEDAESGLPYLDLSGQFWNEGMNVNELASAASPVNILDKLGEAQNTPGIPDTFTLGELSIQFTKSSFEALDALFGENKWILKSFKGDAGRGEGVYTAPAIKKAVDKSPELWAEVDVSKMMVQKLYDLPDDIRVQQAYEKGMPIVKDNEMRVHILTDPQTGEVGVVPFATMNKGETTPLKERIPQIFPSQDQLAAERAALEAIQGLPVEDRMGVIFGADVIRTRDGWGVVELNPTIPPSQDPSGLGGQSGYISDNPYVTDAIVSAMIGKPPLHVEMANAMVNPKQEAPLVNEKKAPAQSEQYTPEEIAASLNVHYDGTMMDMIWMFTDRLEGNPETNPAFGATFAIKAPVTYERVKAKLEETRAKFAAAPTHTYKSPAEATVLSKADAKKLDQVARQTNSRIASSIAQLKTKKQERERVAGEFPLEDSSPLDLYYTTQPHTVATRYAAVFVSEKGGAVAVAESLIQDPSGASLGIESQHDPDVPGVNPLLAAVMENVEVQLSTMRGIAREKLSVKVRARVSELLYTIHEKRRKMINYAGQLTAYTGQLERLLTGYTAVRDHIDSILQSAQQIIGQDATQKMSALAKELNQVWDKYAQTVVNSPKLIAILRKMQKMVDERRFEKGVKQTFARSIEKLQEVTRKAAARAAENIALDEDGESYAEKAAENIVREMTGIPKATDEISPREIFTRVVSKMAREVGTEMGVISPRPKTPKLSMARQFAEILKNEDKYREFTQVLREAYIKEYGGPNPSDRFMEEADYLFNSLSNKMWREGMVDSLVNEKMREINVTLAKIVRDKFSRGVMEIQKIKGDVRQYMKDMGVENEGLVDELVNDIEQAMQDKLNNARNNFFLGEKNIRSFLTKMKTNLATIAKEHASVAEEMRESFETFLVKEYDMPNTDDLPIARTLAQAMHNELNKMVEGERAQILQRWVATESEGKDEKTKRKLDRVMVKVLQLANLGAMKREDIYTALQGQFDFLPKYDAKFAAEVERLADIIGNASTTRQKDIHKQKLAILLSTQKGFTTGEAYISWMYMSMLSGISTPLVNIGGNLTNLIGYTLVEGIKRPHRIPRILSAMIGAATGVAQTEARESFFTGMSMGKEGEKYFRGASPFEVENATFRSDNKIARGKTGKYLDVKLAETTHKTARFFRAYYIGRSLQATDIFFYKIAQEMAYAARQPNVATPQMWESAQKAARNEMIISGQNPDADRATRRRMHVLAYSILQDERLRDSSGALVNERVTAWEEANSEALDASYTNEPRGILGAFARHIQNFTEEKPIGKMVIPFTRVAANVTNQMLDWTPVGMARYLLDQKGNPFKFVEDGKYKKEADQAIRAMLGMGMMLALLAMLSDEDEEDPYFTVYGAGPRDANQRRQMQQRGWKPNSIKVGDKYFSYIYWPVAMALSIVGRRMDQFRDGKTESPRHFGFVADVVSLLDAVKNQSFLVTMSDLMSAADGPDPENNFLRISSRFATIPIPNLFKQIDKFVDPSIQEGRGFWQSMLKEIPVVRQFSESGGAVKPMLNVFGEPISRTGVVFPGSERFMSQQIRTDEVMNFVGDNMMTIPGYSKSTRIGDRPMTPEEYYRYVQEAGPRVKKAIQAELPALKRMTHEDAQERIDKIAGAIKSDVRAKIKKDAKLSLTRK